MALHRLRCCVIVGHCTGGPGILSVGAIRVLKYPNLCLARDLVRYVWCEACAFPMLHCIWDAEQLSTLL
jgi:hypothetical protein